MPDWNLDLPFDAEPTRVPTSDECEHSARGENCGRTDCAECGEDAASWLCAAATASVAGIVALAREVLRVSGLSTQYVVTGRDLARLRDCGPTRSHATWMRAWSWAEGVLDAVSGRNAWLQRHDYERSPPLQAAYMIGRMLVELHLVSEHLTALEAQSMAAAAREPAWHERPARDEQPAQAPVQRESPVHGKPWIYPDEFEPLSSAAGAPSAPPTTPTLPARTPADEGPGWESRAQHAPGRLGRLGTGA